MATLRGEQGAVQFDAAGSSNATIISTRSWSRHVQRNAGHQRSGTNFVGTMISGSGTVELVFYPSTAGQAAFIEDVLTIQDPADATFELFTDGTTSGTDSVSFNGIITETEIASTVGELVVVSCNFITSGAITSP